MSVPRIDMSNVEEFVVLPAGQYDVVVTDIEFRKSKTTEFPYISWELTVLSGPAEDRKLWLNTSLSPKALFRLKQTLEGLGVNDVPQQIEGNDLIEAMMGAKAVAEVGVREYEGRNQNEVKRLVRGHDTVTIVIGKSKAADNRRRRGK